MARKKETRAQLEEQIHALINERHALQIAVSVFVTGESPDADQAYTPDGEHTYTAKLYRATAPHGGLVLTTCAKIPRFFHVALLDDEIAAARACRNTWPAQHRAIMYLDHVRTNMCISRDWQARQGRPESDHV